MAIIKWFLQTRFWVWIATNFFGLFTCRILGYPKFKMENFFQLASAVKKSGIGIYAVTGTDTQAASFKLEHLMTKACYSHAGLLFIADVEDLSTYRFLHITSRGLASDHILDYLREVDKIAIVKLPVSTTLTAFVYKEMESHVKDKDLYGYDFAFDLGSNKKLYCSELVYKIVSSYTNKIKTTIKNGQKFVTPDNIFESGEIVYIDG
jgi:hypothetical protein